MRTMCVSYEMIRYRRRPADNANSHKSNFMNEHHPCREIDDNSGIVVVVCNAMTCVDFYS